MQKEVTDKEIFFLAFNKIFFLIFLHFHMLFKYFSYAEIKKSVVLYFSLHQHTSPPFRLQRSFMFVVRRVVRFCKNGSCCSFILLSSLLPLCLSCFKFCHVCSFMYSFRAYVIHDPCLRTIRAELNCHHHRIFLNKEKMSTV